MIGVRLEQAKAAFFDSAKVMAATTAAERKNLSKFGAFVRRRARSSIRKKKKSSPPGLPPASHGRELLKKNIFFVFEPIQRSLVIGPVKLNAQVGNAPEALEHGGESEIVVGPRRKRKKVTVRVEQRPFMQPAFDAELKELDPLWRNSIR